MNRERICNTKALEWILREVSVLNMKVTGDIRQFITSGDFQDIIKTYNRFHEQGLKMYSIDEVDGYAKQETRKYMVQLQRDRIDDVQLY